ncbi:MAG: Mor transcription activator family protein [Methylococcales bacterium]|nr:Mor transcription activator family protein [Methylococcales bacterium]
MDEILKAIGEPAATLLTDAFGGGIYYIPEKCDKTGVFNEIVKVIGQAAADVMVKLAGGELVSIPQQFAEKLQRRNEAIFNERRAGAGMRELALKYRMSQRHVHSCIKKHRQLIGQH